MNRRALLSVHGASGYPVGAGLEGVVADTQTSGGPNIMRDRPGRVRQLMVQRLIDGRSIALVARAQV